MEFPEKMNWELWNIVVDCWFTIYILVPSKIRNPPDFFVSIYNLALPQIKIILGFFVYCHKVLLGQQPSLLRHPERTIKCCYPLSRGQEEKGVRREIAQQHGLSSWAEGTWVEHHSETEIKPSGLSQTYHVGEMGLTKCLDQPCSGQTWRQSSWALGSPSTPHRAWLGLGRLHLPSCCFLRLKFLAFSSGAESGLELGCLQCLGCLSCFLSNESAYEVTNSSLIIGSMLDALPIYVYFLRTILLYFSFF